MDRIKDRVEVFVPDAWKHKTLNEAREYLGSKKEEGVACPCCGQYAKVYYRKFNRNMARFLMSLAKNSSVEKKWIHYKDCEYSSRDYAGITYWGLASIRKSDGETKRSSGYWLPTKKGVDFINGKIEIPSHVIIFTNKIDWSRGGFSSTHISIEDALGEEFSFEELLGARKIVRSWAVLNEEPRTVANLLELTKKREQEIEHAEDSRAPASPTPIQGE